jgi:hypothetical protein
MSFKELFVEATETLDCQKIEKSFKKYFPKGFFKCKRQKSFGGNEVYYYKFGMIGNERDQSHGIIDNDPIYHGGVIFVNETPDGETYELSPSRGGLSVNPDDPRMAMKTIKTKMRKTKGDAKKIEKYFDTVFKRIYDLVKENQDNFYWTGDPKVLDKYKV